MNRRSEVRLRTCEAERFFERLAETGEVEETRDYPGTLVTIPGAGTVGLRPISTSGPPAIDVRIEGVRIDEIKFVE